MTRPLDTPLQRIAIIGTGLMGGSIGLAVRRAGLSRSISGFDLEPGHSKRALERNSLTEVADSMEQAVRDAQLVVIATPVDSVPDTYASFRDFIGPGAVVTDIGSSKSRIVAEISKHIPEGTHFVGGHPIAGSEQEGIDAASADLFEGSTWILTPTPETDTDTYGALVRFLGGLGAKVLALEPKRHDELVAFTSHLPQVLSSVLMGFAAEISSAEGGLPLVTAGGFKDMTRISASSADLWVGILKENREIVSEVLQRFEGALSDARSLIEGQDWEALRGFLHSARQAHADLPRKPGQDPKAIAELLVPVPDRPGVLAEVTTGIGELGINIEDMNIVHSGGRGTIHLTLASIDLDRATSALRELGYEPHLGPLGPLGPREHGDA